MAIRQPVSRFSIITPSFNGDIQPLGPAGTPASVAVMMVQFAPSVDFVGSFQVLAKAFGPGAETAPYLPVAYRRVNVAGAAADYAIVADNITSSGIIQVPANGLIIALLVTCTVGQCQVYTLDLQGPSSI